MPARRILSLWFPRLGAERLLRLGAAGAEDAPFAVARDSGQMQVLVWLSDKASAAGLVAGQPLRDAHAMCPTLVTRLQNEQAEAMFLNALRRWAGKFSPWVGEEPPAGLILDISGCAHLFGGEEAMVCQIHEDCHDMGLSVEAGIADTPGGAWALARYAGQSPQATRNGDAIDQEAHATRSRASKRRHWERGGTPPPQVARGRRGPAVRQETDHPALADPHGLPRHALPAPVLRIAAPGQTREAISPLPAAALRIDAETVTHLARLGLTHVGDLLVMPRAGLARRFGQHLVLRIDQASGAAPEPVSPVRPPPHFAVRLSLPEPIGLETDLLAGVDRLLPPLCAKLRDQGRGARRVRLQAWRSDQTMAQVEVGLARPSANPERLRPLLAMKLGDIDAGFGIDMIRLEAHVTEPVHDRQHRGHLEAASTAADYQRASQAGETAVDDLIGRLGARIGLDEITRRHPADSHIPEKGALTLAAAWSPPGPAPWPGAPVPRPVLLWRPEMVSPPNGEDGPALPLSFRWRRRDLHVASALGPERIAPEWWLDMADWRSGVRDYWRVICREGEELWLFYAHGGAVSGGWFCQGSFA